MITINSADLEDLLFCSFRYALGRRTYITWTVANLLVRHKDDVKPNFKHSVCREILSAIERGEAGMDMDVGEWRKVYEEYSDAVS